MRCFCFVLWPDVGLYTLSVAGRGGGTEGGDLITPVNLSPTATASSCSSLAQRGGSGSTFSEQLFQNGDCHWHLWWMCSYTSTYTPPLLTCTSCSPSPCGTESAGPEGLLRSISYSVLSEIFSVMLCYIIVAYILNRVTSSNVRLAKRHCSREDSYNIPLLF